MRRLAWATLICASTFACFPEFDDRPWLIDEQQVLAVRSNPAEQRPGQAVMLEALVVDPTGSLAAAVQWHACNEPRRVEERTGVTQMCAAGDDLTPLGAPAIVPSDACARFGPNPPPSEGDEPPRRPADPDPSGGYYLPVRAEVTSVAAVDPSFGAVRIHCDLAGVKRDVFDEYQDRYTFNENPAIERVELVHGDGTRGDLSLPGVVKPSEIVDIVVSAPMAAEPYIVYRTADSRLHDVSESVTVRWFVSDGELDRASEYLPDAASLATPVETTWHAPGEVGLVHGWVVISDARGGVTWQAFEIDVRG